MGHGQDNEPQHARPHSPAPAGPGPTRSANIATEPGAIDGSEGCPVSPLVPNSHIAHIRFQRPLGALDDTSSEPEETALPRDYLAKVWRESTQASRLESGTSASTVVTGDGPSLPRKRCALPVEDPPAARQRIHAPCTVLNTSIVPPSGTDGPADGIGLPPASASIALLAYTNQIHDHLKAAMGTKMAQLEAQVNSVTEHRHIGGLLAKEAAEASALRMAALERRCADLEVRNLEFAAEQRATRENLEAALAAVSSLMGAAAADAAAARREAAALREMAQKAYSQLLGDVSTTMNGMQQQIAEMKAQQDELAEAVAVWRSANAAPAISSESMRASNPY